MSLSEKLSIRWLVAVVVAIMLLCILTLLTIKAVSNAGESAIYSRIGEFLEYTDEAFAKADENRLDILFSNPKSSEPYNPISNTTLDYEVQLSFRTTTHHSKVDVEIDTDVDDMHNTNIEVQVGADGDTHQSGYNENAVPIPINSKNQFLFPFDTLHLNQQITIDPKQRWKEVSLYNYTDIFVFDGSPKLVERDESLYLSAVFKRSTFLKLLLFFFLIVCFIYLLFILVVVRNRAVLIWNWAIFSGIYALGRVTMLPRSISPVTLFDVFFLVILVILLTVSMLFLTDRAAPTYKIFISYRRESGEFAANKIYNALKSKFGSNAVFLDTQTIQISTNFLSEIDQAIKSSKVFVLVVGKNWLGTDHKTGKRLIDREIDYSRIEVEKALQYGLRIIPVIVESAEFPTEDELPKSIRGVFGRSGVVLRASDNDFRHDIERLYGQMRNLII